MKRPACSHWELNWGHPWLELRALPLSYDNRTTTSPHNSLYVLHRWYCFQHEARCSEHFDWENHSAWVLPDGKNFWSTPNRVLMAHTEWLPGVWLRYFSTTCAIHIENCWGLVVGQLAQWQSTGEFLGALYDLSQSLWKVQKTPTET